MVKILNEPKLRQYLVLAYQIQETLDPSTSFRVNPERSRGIERNNTLISKQAAEWLGMTAPRVSQIMDLLLLCPKIQRDILLSTRKAFYKLGEYNVRKIVAEPLWEKQIEIWHTLLKTQPFNKSSGRTEGRLTNQVLTKRW